MSTTHNATVTVLIDGEPQTHNVWVLAGDQLAAAKKHPVPEGDNRWSFLDVNQERNAHIAYRAAVRHDVIDGSVNIDDFVDTMLIDYDFAAKDADDPDPLEDSAAATADESS